jgi:uncharacterized membrane protein
MSKPMFFFNGVYETVAQAEQDYDAIKRLHHNKDIGSYDAAVLTKAMDGKVSVNKDEKPVKHGAYAGLAAAIGAGVGAWMGHLAHGMSRRDAKAMAAQLQPGQAALIVVGIDEDSAKVEQATGASLSHVTKHLEGSDFDEAEDEAMASLEAQEAPSA